LELGTLPEPEARGRAAHASPAQARPSGRRRPGARFFLDAPKVRWDNQPRV